MTNKVEHTCILTVFWIIFSYNQTDKSLCSFFPY